LDWSDSGEAMTISLTLSVDYCILQYWFKLYSFYPSN
jgi:hypothetical protein